MRVAGLILAVLAFGLAPMSAGARGPRANSDEYKKSWGLEAIGARVAYNAGLTGRGVTVAIIDCGIARAQKDVIRNVSRRSTDVVEGRKLPITDLHGAYTSAPLAAALDGRGMVGVAYNAKILSVRADIEGGLFGSCAFKPSDLAKALDFAADQKARIVVLPLQGRKPLGAAFERALGRVVEGGGVVVIAAGNRNSAQPAWPALYAVDSRYAGAIIVAGATGYYGAITPWSNKAGTVKPWYIAAPGEWVLTDCKAKCHLVSGTSFSTSYVAGGLALMMEAWPDQSGRQLVGRLLASARDAGAVGMDEIYGRGILDLTHAFGAD